MASRSSPAVTALAVFHFVGGGLGLIQSLCTGFGLIVIVATGGNLPGPPPPGPGAPPQGFDSAAFQIHLIQNVPGYIPAHVATAAVGLIFDVLLIVAGIGLLGRRQWARYATLVYAALSIVFKVGWVIYQFVFINPVAKAYLDAHAGDFLNPGERAGAQFRAMYGGVVYSLVLLLYPIVAVAVLMMPSVVRSFDHGRDAEEDDYHDRRRYDDRDDYRRRDRDDEDDEDRSRYRREDRGGRWRDERDYDR